MQNSPIPPKKIARIDFQAIMEGSSLPEDMKAKREMADNLLYGIKMDKDEKKAVSLLEDCAAQSDDEAMVMLAKCCTTGCGIERSVERAKALLSDAANRGNNEACILMDLINFCKGKQSVDIGCLHRFFFHKALGETHICVFVVVLQRVSKEIAR